jgi:hypothetical protein
MNRDTRSPALCAFKPVAALAALLAAVAQLAGCAGGQTVAMSAEDRASVRDYPVIHVVHYQSGPMNMMTPSDAVSGGILVQATGSTKLPRWYELERKHRLPDASVALRDSVVPKLQADGGLTSLRVQSQMLPLPVVEDLGAYRDKYRSGLVLEITTPGRGATYGVMSWRTYSYGLYGKARLIRLRDSKVIWADTCLVEGKDDEKLKFDVSEFEANNAARLKEMIRYSSDRCGRILVDSLLGRKS